MKKIFIAIALLTLAGCASHEISPSQNYVLGKENIRVTGNLDRKAEPPFLSEKRTLTVFFNGEPVLTGQLPESWVGEFDGKYKGHKVTALCSGERKSLSWVAVTCPILIDEKRAVTLTF